MGLAASGGIGLAGTGTTGVAATGATGAGSGKFPGSGRRARARALFAEAADTTSAAFTDEIQRHGREELEGYCRETRKHGVKPEVESFHYGGIWNALRLVKLGLLDTPVWTTFFLGWPGGCWTPPTVEAMQYMHDHKPEEFNYSVSVMDPPTHWQVLTKSILLGGHVRVGMEDSPYLDGGKIFAKSNAELVEKIVRISHELGREIASPEEARRIIGLPSANDVAQSHAS